MISAVKIHFINGMVVLLYWKKQAYITIHTTQQVACELEDCLHIIKLKKNLQIKDNSGRVTSCALSPSNQQTHD